MPTGYMQKSKRIFSFSTTGCAQANQTNPLYENGTAPCVRARTSVNAETRKDGNHSPSSADSETGMGRIFAGKRGYPREAVAVRVGRLSK